MIRRKSGVPGFLGCPRFASRGSVSPLLHRRKVSAGHAAFGVVDEAKDVAVRVVEGDQLSRRDVEWGRFVEDDALRLQLFVGRRHIIDFEPDSRAAAAGTGAGGCEDEVAAFVQLEIGGVVGR